MAATRLADWVEGRFSRQSAIYSEVDGAINCFFGGVLMAFHSRQIGWSARRAARGA